VIQFNEVSGMKGDLDGQAFDSDDNCVGTVTQYNYSHDNDGGFVLVCSCGDAEPGSIWLRDTVIRYNISQNDGARLFHIGGPVRDVYAYNNTFCVGEGLGVHAVLQTEDEGWPDRTFFWNNIFYADGTLDYDFGESTHFEFCANAYYGRHEGRPADARAITDDPGLAAPGSGNEGLESLDGYKLLRNSPCMGAGVAVSGNGGRDFWGNCVSDAEAPDIGAHSASSDPAPGTHARG
jgi:hypothetical protein